MTILPDHEKEAFHRIISDTTRHYADMRQCGQPIPSWLQKQVDAIYKMETDPQRGMAMLAEGLQDEHKRLTELLYG